MTNYKVTGFNKTFLYATMVAPGNTHFLDGNLIRNKAIQLGDFGQIPLVTIGDSAFPQ